MSLYKLHVLLKEELKGDTKDLVTRPSGEKIRRRIERDMAGESAGEVISLDFSGIGIIDYSCADEIVAKLISRLISDEYGDKYLLLMGLNENQKENIEVALERKGLAVMGNLSDGKQVVIGSLNNYLKETLAFIAKKRKATAGDYAEALKLPANTSGTRLLNLYKKRLVKRIEETRSDGKAWTYTLLQG